MNWCVDFSFSATTLRSLDIVPLLVNTVSHIQQRQHDHIYTIFAELCSNALEHGLLKLDSELKRTAIGFEEYYRLRAERLARLNEGSIKVSLSHRIEPSGESLLISMEDSGDGFNYQDYVDSLTSNERLCGRGIILLKELCSQLDFHGNGNIVHAQYQWQ